MDNVNKGLVKRLTWNACDVHNCHCDVVESADGDMVNYEDYVALLKERDALAVENAGLKSYIRDECYVTPPNSGPMAEADTAAEDYMPETPATDAAIANIQAQGVEKFADKLDLDATFADESGWDGAAKFLRAEATRVREFSAELRKEASNG